MKRWFVLLAMTVAVFTHAKTNDNDGFIFYGMDCSQAKTYGAIETPAEFKYMFRDINNLFKADPKKYDVKKIFKRPDCVVRVEPAQELLNKIDLDALKAFNKVEFALSYEAIETFIRDFNTGEDTGTGVIAIANFFDRSKNRATYNVVVFDIETKEIISNKQVTAKATGPDFKTFWANSLMTALKQSTK